MRMQAYRARFTIVHIVVAIRVCSTYHTVSRDAALVIAGIVPIEDMIEKRTRVTAEDKEDRNPRRKEKHNKKMAKIMGGSSGW